MPRHQEGDISKILVSFSFRNSFLQKTNRKTDNLEKKTEGLQSSLSERDLEISELRDLEISELRELLNIFGKEIGKVCCRFVVDFLLP